MCRLSVMNHSVNIFKRKPHKSYMRFSWGLIVDCWNKHSPDWNTCRYTRHHNTEECNEFFESDTLQERFPPDYKDECIDAEL